ncbi:MAG: CPXCG motif-containing cysteine-rich protein [Gemmatimonadales bacterium]|nr:MAG: CPXCG motif-containing cysteine-rich protein [Gemmatimonadales bacterium]
MTVSEPVPDPADFDRVADVTCPYCGEEVEVILDPGGASHQQYVEDCEVCCRPWHLDVRWDRRGDASVTARTEEQ